MKTQTSDHHTIPGFETRTNIGLNPLADPAAALVRQEKKDARAAAKKEKKDSKRLAKKRRKPVEPLDVIMMSMVGLIFLLVGFMVWAMTNYFTSGGLEITSKAQDSVVQIMTAQELYSQVNGTPGSPDYGSLEELKESNFLPADFNSGEHGDAAINLQTGERADGSGEWFSVTAFTDGFMTSDYGATSESEDVESVESNMSYEDAIALYGTGH